MGYTETVKQRTWTTRQNGSLQNENRFSQTHHRTESCSPNIQKTQEISNQKNKESKL